MIIVPEKWASTIFLIISITSRSGKSQMPMTFPNMFAAPPPMPMAMPGMGPMAPMGGQIFGLPMPPPQTMILQLIRKKGTTTPKPIENDGGAIAIPMPVQMPVQMAIPAMSPPAFCRNKSRHRGCPACPPCVCSPSCTPAFFSYCSRCHLACRCRSAEDTPLPRAPLPPQPLPGPAFAVAFPPPAPVAFPLGPVYKKRNRHNRNHRETEESYNSASDSGEEPKRFKRTFRRSNQRKKSGAHNDFVRPEISYIAQDGEVKISRPISNAEAEQLLRDENSIQTITSSPYHDHSSTVLDYNDASKVQLEYGSSQLSIAQDPLATKTDKRLVKLEPQGLVKNVRKRVMRTDVMPEMLGSGKKHLIFRPPADRKISNISVSFTVT